MEVKNKHKGEQIMYKNYFENPITKRFIDAFPKFKADEGEDGVYFWEGWRNSPFYDDELTEQDLSNIYYHMRAKYYNWHFIYMDDLGISDNVYHIIEDYYPNCKERLALVKQLRDMGLEEFKQSGIFIDSQGANPKIEKQMGELIDLVDSQSASFQLKSQEQVLKAKFTSLYDGVMEQFIDRFQPLFVKLYNGVNSYIYRNPIESDKNL